MSDSTILIADDDHDLVQILSLRCRGMGLHVLTANNGMAALTLAHARQPRLICLDLHMPSGNGLSVCEMIASDPTLSQIPVVILTGAADNETIRRCHSLCAYYVQKCSDVWSRLGPLIGDLLAEPPLGASTLPPARP